MTKIKESDQTTVMKRNDKLHMYVSKSAPKLTRNRGNRDQVRVYQPIAVRLTRLLTHNKYVSRTHRRIFLCQVW